MCGMPLPHRPITAPGAHSTLNFTRVPVDSRARERNAAGDGTAGSTRSIGIATAEPAAVVPNSEAPEAASASTANSTLASVQGPPPKELVPDIPLDEYVQSFHYQPPRDPAEITMHGDAHVADPTAEVPKPENATVADAPTVPANEVAEAGPPLASTPVADGEDVDSRLGLEPESADEARIARPRFLDISEPPKEPTSAPPEETAPANGGMTIGGPSFLGLSDGPQNWAEAVGVERGEYAPRNYHWRAWFAVLVVAGLGALGYLQWRSQVNQTYNGPVEVIRTKLRGLRQSAMSQIAGDSSANNNDNAKPDMQVQEQPKGQAPQQTVEPGAVGAGQESSAQPQQPAMSAQATGQSATAQPNPATTPPKADAGQTSATNPPAAKSAKTPADNSAAGSAAKLPAQRAANANSDLDSAAKPVPGADEMAKARNASDSAAAAAWLWKATAKGNPDAPVELANMYIQGDGVPRSCEQAMVLLKTASEKENAHARSRLASMYANGTCVPRNRVEAYRWLSSALAANPGSQWAQQNRDLIWEQMNPEERSEAQRYR